jgi:serine protease
MKKNLLIWLTVFGLGIINSFSQTAVPGCVDGRIYLKYKPNAVVKYKNPNDIDPKNLPGMQALISKYGVNFAERPYWMVDDDKDLPRIYKVGFTSLTSVDDFIRDISNNPLVEYAEKVPLCTTTYTTNDPSGPTLSGNQWFLNTINATNAWNIQNGTSTVVVAVVDNAIMRTHPDLVGNIYVNPGEIAGNSIDDDGNGYVDDVNGYDVGDNDNSVLPLNTSWSHGTHCSGLVGARTDNTVGISSIGFNLKILPVKATANSAGFNAVTNGYGGIVYAVRTKARVISCSWGGTVSATSDQSVITYAFNKGCAVIVSAGNDNNAVLHYPAAYTNAYAVASSGTGNVKSGFSCFGTWVDITSPGESIYSTVPNTGYTNMQGTSMACPIVAGLAGLMLSKNPYLTPTQVLNCISTSAANIYTISGNSAWATPPRLGAGRIEAYQAMLCASVTPGSAPSVDFISDKQNTCPLNPIKFTDLSTLFPTAWAWTFQGGSPATSTLANPTVSWTTAGTYSVGLTATNINGSGSITKIGYITISNPTTLPLVEGFQGAAWPPINWVDDNKGLDSIKWERATTCGGYGLSTASLLFDNYYDDASGTRDGFQMPKLNMSSVTQATLNFDVAHARYDATYSDSLRVMLSTNCGQTWTQIFYKGGTALSTAPDYTANLFVPTSTQWRTESIVITGLAAGQSNVLMSFVNQGHYGNGIYIDNVNISYSTTAGPTANFNSTPNICTGAATTFTDTSVNSPTSWNWSIPGASVPTSTLQNPSVTFTTSGAMSVTLTVANAAGNNTMVQTVFVTQTPTAVAITGSTSVCSGSSATLTASGASTYTWNPGSLSGTSIVVTPTSTITYSLVGYNGVCVGNTAIKTLSITPNPTVSINSSTICSGNTATLTASGATTYSWNTGSTATSINPTPTITTNYTVTGTTSGCTNTRTTSVVVTPNPTVSVNSSTICAGGTATLTASGATTYSWSTGSTATSINPTPALTTTYNVVGTTSGCTNIRTATVTVAPNPTVSVNSATICAGNSTNLTASGATTYSWNTSATTNSISVSPTITTNYTVTGSTGSCVNTRTTSVTVNALPSLTLASSSNTACTISSGGITLTLTGTPAGGVYSGPGVVGSTFTAQTVAGTYTTTYSYTNSTTGCANSTVKTITVAVCTGVEGLNIDGELLVYPNPNNGVFTVQANFENAFDVLVYNNIGQLVKEVKELKGVNQIDMSGYAQGIYNIVLRVNDNYKTIKMVIE